MDLERSIISAPAAELAAEITLIWRECFPSPDSGSDARLFAGCSGAKTLLLTVNGAPAGMCNILPVSAGTLRGCYLFAVGVRPAFRGNGGFRLLCKEAEDTARAEGLDFLTLVPADEGLAATYRRFGYTENVNVPRREISGKDLESLTPTDSFPAPQAESDRMIMPSHGFLRYLRGSYLKFRLGDSFLLCGEERYGKRQVYEYIPGTAPDIRPLPSPTAAHGLLLPLTGDARRLCRMPLSFYCSMGED